MPFSIYKVFGHRLSRKAPYRRLMRAKEVVDNIRLPTELSRLLRSRLTPFYLGDKSKRSKRASQKSRMQ